MKTFSPNLKYILVTLIIGFLWITFNQTGLIKLYSLKNERSILMNQIELLELHEEMIGEHIEKLTNNLEYIEFLAYSKFQMVKPGEKIYKIKDFKDVNK